MKEDQVKKPRKPHKYRKKKRAPEAANPGPAPASPATVLVPSPLLSHTLPLSDGPTITAEPEEPITNEHPAVPVVTIKDEVVDQPSFLQVLLTHNIRVKVQTLFDDNYEGTVYSYDTVTNTVTLITAPNDYRIMKISFLRDVTVVSAASPPTPVQPAGAAGPAGVKGPFSNAEPKVAPVSIQSVEGRERAAVRAEVEKLSNKGVGVTQEAQDIYDALSRTMKCRWHGKNIIVMDMVNISEPYTAESCVAPQSNSGALNRVKKVLDGERKRLEASRRGSPVPANPAERKGG